MRQILGALCLAIGLAGGALAQSGQYPNNTVAGNVSGAAGPVTPLTQAQVTTLCNLVTATLSGCAPAFPNTTNTFFRGDGSYNVPPTVTSGAPGYAPAFPNNTTTFFRGDGTYANISGGGFAAQSANTIFAGPASGSAATPAFRALVGADIPVANGTTCPSNLQTYAPFANTTSSPTGTTLNIWDGTQCVPWATLNQTAHTLTLTGSTGSALAQALTISQTPSGTQSGSFNANSITVTSSAALTGAASFLQGLDVGCSAQTTNVQGGINCGLFIAGLNSPTNTSNANHNYVGITGIGQANSADGGTNTGAGAQGAIFGANFVGNAVSGATNLLELTAGEVDCSLQTGSSAKLKMCWSIVSTSFDAVHGASVDAGLTIGAQTGAGGFNNGIRFTTANGIFPVPSSGTLVAADTGTVTHGIDLSSVTCSADCFKSSNFVVDTSGDIIALNIRPTAGYYLGNSATLLISDTAPMIASGFCTSPSIPANNGVGAFTINVGTSCGAGSTGTLTMPAATTAWVCQFHDVTTPASNIVEQTGGTTTSVTLTNYVRTTGVAGGFTSSDVIRAACIAY